MSTLAMRHYNLTFAAYNDTPERRIRDVKKMLRTKVSRRRFKQIARSILYRFPLPSNTKKYA